MMDLEIWLDLAVGIVALGAIGFGAWVYFASQKGKEVSLPKLNVKLPTLKPENKGEVRKRISGSVNRLLGREEKAPHDYVVPEEDSLIVPIKSTTLPSNRKLDLDDLYDKAKAFDEAEENDVDHRQIGPEPTTPKVQLAVPVSPTPERAVQEESLVEETSIEEILPKAEPVEETVAETFVIEESPITEVQEEINSQTPVVEELQENVPHLVQEEVVEPPISKEEETPVLESTEVAREEKKSFEVKKPIVKHPLHNLRTESTEEVSNPVGKGAKEGQHASSLPALQRADGGVPFSFAQFLLLIQTGIQKTVKQTKEKISQVTSSVNESKTFKPKPRAEYEANQQNESGLKGRMKTIVKMVSSIFQRGVEKVQEKTDLPRRAQGEDDMVEIAAQTTRNGRTPYLNFFKIDKVPTKQNGVLLGLQNIGWTLNYDRVEVEQHNQVTLYYRAPQRYSTSPATYPQGSLICFDITSSGGEDFVYHFKVFFQDKNGTTYSQEIYGQGVFPPVIKDPEILTKSEGVPERVS